MTLQPFDQRCFYSVDEFAALPEDKSMFYELVNGRIVAQPRPAMPHQIVVTQLLVQLDAQLPGDLLVVSEIDLDLELSRPVVRIPDLVVVRKTVARKRGLAKASEALLAVEVLSPSYRKDTKLKLRQYAEAGIPHVWLVSPKRRVTATTYGLVDGRYEERQRAVHTLAVDEPCELRVDLDALLPVAFD